MRRTASESTRPQRDPALSIRCVRPTFVIVSVGLSSAEDQKILALIRDPAEQLSAAEGSAIIQRIGNAPFKNKVMLLKFWNEFGPDYLGQPHPGRPAELLTRDSLLSEADLHALKHAGRGGWPAGTRTDEYLSDIKTLVLCETERLHVGKDPESQGQDPPQRAATETGLTRRTNAAIKATFPPDACFAVFYHPPTGTIVSSYPIKPSNLVARLRRWMPHRSFDL